jgi:cytochrome b
MARWVAPSGVDPATLVAGAPDTYNKVAYDEMRAFRKRFIINNHVYAFYGLLVIAGLHILGVVVTEIREGADNISATFTGRKTIAGSPVDAEPAGDG